MGCWTWHKAPAAPLEEAIAKAEAAAAQPAKRARTGQPVGVAGNNSGVFALSLMMKHGHLTQHVGPDSHRAMRALWSSQLDRTGCTLLIDTGVLSLTAPCMPAGARAA